MLTSSVNGMEQLATNGNPFIIEFEIHTHTHTRINNNNDSASNNTA